MARSKSSRRWLDRHVSDEFVKRAQRDGYRSRAAYKLLEIQQKDQILRRGQLVVDLGAAPGAWSQVARDILGETGQIIALDILPMDPLPGVEIIQGDFRENSVAETLLQRLAGRKADVVISDIAPNITGTAAIDQPRAMYLCELALDFCCESLKRGGDFIVKAFQGEGYDLYMQTLRKNFANVVVRKPKASRDSSREVYLVGRNFRV